MAVGRKSMDEGRSALDPLERRIVAELQRDGRLPTSEIARRVDASEVTVRRRLRRLLDSKTIEITARVDPFRVGYKIPVAVFLKVEQGKLDHVAEQLSAHGSVRYVAAISGRWNLFVEVVASTNDDVARFLLEDVDRIGGIRDIESSLILTIYTQRWNWGEDDLGAIETDGGVTGASEAQAFDELDLQVLAELERDGRVATTELARRIGTSEVTARRRLHRLLETRAVHVVASVNPFDVGYRTPAVVFLRLDHAKRDEVALLLSRHRRVGFVAAMTGRWGLFFEVVAATTHDFARFLAEEVEPLPGVREVEGVLILRIYRDWGIGWITPRRHA